MAQEQPSLLYTILKVRREELPSTALHFVYLLNVVGAFIIGRTVASSLFLSEYDADKLPWMYVASAAAVSLSSWGYSRVSGRVRLDHLIMLCTAGLLVASLALRLATGVHMPMVYPVLYVMVEVMGSMLIIQFWSFANSMHNTREAKRLFGVIGAGGVLANIIVGFGSAALVGLVGTENLLFVMAGNLGLCILFVGMLGRRGKAQLAAALSGGSSSKKKKIAISSDTARVFASKHLRIIAGIVALTFVVTTLVDYQFKIIAKETYDKTELTAFFSLLYGFTGILSIFIQLFVTGRLLERFGIMMGLSLLPASLTLGSGFLLLFPSAFAGAIAKGADAVFRYTVNDATTQLLYLPVPAQNRLKAKAFIDGILKPVSYGATGLFLALLLSAWPEMNHEVHLLAIVSTVFGIAWLALVIGVRKEYVKSLLDTLRRRRLHLDETHIRISDQATLKALARSLESERDAEVINALQLLAYVDGGDWDRHVVRLLDHESEEIRYLALEYLSESGSLEYGTEVHRKFEDPSDRVKAAAITTYCAIGREKSIRAVQDFLGDDSPAIRAAAMVGLIKFGGLDGVLAAAEALKGMLEHEDPALREHGARVLGAIEVKNFYQPVLRLLRDPELRVQLAAIESAGRMGSPELIPSLVYKLADKSTSGAATAALARYDEGIQETLAKVLGNEDEDRVVRRNIPRILARIGDDAALAALCGALDTEDATLRHRIAQAIVRVINRRPDLQAPSGPLHEALNRELGVGFQILQDLDNLKLDDAPLADGGLLVSALEDKLAHTVERLFLLLGAMHDGRTMEVVFHNLHTGTANVRANALEVLDNSLDKDLKRPVLALVDETPRKEKLGNAEEVTQVIVRSAEASIAALTEDSDPWVAACAIRLSDTRAKAPDPSLAAAVQHRLKDASWVVRETTGVLLARHLDGDARETLLEKLLEDPHPGVRRVAATL